MSLWGMPGVRSSLSFPLRWREGSKKSYLDFCLLVVSPARLVHPLSRNGEQRGKNDIPKLPKKEHGFFEGSHGLLRVGVVLPYLLCKIFSTKLNLFESA